VFIVVGVKSKKAAKEVEDYFQTTGDCKTYECKKKKTRGGTPGQGTRRISTMVYAYKITSKTTEE
jgi:hypothetical protein